MEVRVIMEIRKATKEDLIQLANIEKRCFPSQEAASLKEFESRYLAFRENFLVLEENKKIIGFINGCSTNSQILYDELYHDASLHEENGKYMTVFGLDVDVTYQHQGYATKLMNAYIELARQRNKEGIILTCKDHLIGFYEKFGYKHLGVSKSTHGGALWNDMIYLF